jgi:hypothetical protein
LDLATYAILLAGALAGGFVSGLAGFGTALMALGIWLYILPPAIAVPLVLICSVSSQISTLPSMWKLLDFKLALPFVAGGLLGMPIGALLVARADPQVFKLSVGVMLLVFPAALYFIRTPMAFRFGGRVADACVGFAGGILGGLAGLSGPLPTLAGDARHADRRPPRHADLSSLERPEFLRRRTRAAVSVGARIGVEQHCSEIAAHGRHVLRVDCCTLTGKAANQSHHDFSCVTRASRSAAGFCRHGDLRRHAAGDADCGYRN